VNRFFSPHSLPWGAIVVASVFVGATVPVVYAQKSPAKASPSASAEAKSSSTPSSRLNLADPKVREKNPDAVAALQDRIKVVADKVFGRIETQEADLYKRFGYFQKPERLDPNNFASEDEITPWFKLLDDMKASRDTVANLYGSADKDLSDSLTEAKVMGDLAAGIKKELIGSIPWDVVDQKNRLLLDYIDEHRELLTFYQKNWGHWSQGSTAGKPTFDNPELTSTYNHLRDRVVSTGTQIQRDYSKLGQQ
jgi:hypothetical protein